jgi:cytochrome b561
MAMLPPDLPSWQKLVATHLGAALFHVLIRRDSVLQSMV